jgi:hypothetical protein
MLTADHSGAELARIVIGTSVPNSGRKRIYLYNRSYLNSWRYENEIVPTPAAGGSTQWGTDFVADTLYSQDIVVNDPATPNNLIYRYNMADFQAKGSPWAQFGTVVSSSSGAVLSTNNLVGSPLYPKLWVAGNGNPATLSSYQLIDANGLTTITTFPATYVPSTICSYVDGSFFASIDSAGSNVVKVKQYNNPDSTAVDYTITIPSTSPIADIRMNSITNNGNGLSVIVIAVPAHNGNTGVVYIYKGTTLMQTITSPSPFAGERFGQSIDVGNYGSDVSNTLIIGTGQNQTATGGKVYMYTGDLNATPLVYDGSWSNPATTVGNATQYFGKAVCALYSTLNQVAVSDPFNSVVYCLRKLSGVWTVAHG